MSLISGRRASKCDPRSSSQQAGHGGLPDGGGGAPGAGAGRSARPNLPDIQDVSGARGGTRPGHGLALQRSAG